MPHHSLRADTPAYPQLCEGILNDEQRRLRMAGKLELLSGFFGLGSAGKEQCPQIDTSMACHLVAALIHYLAEDRFLFVQVTAHVDVL